MIKSVKFEKIDDEENIVEAMRVAALYSDRVEQQFDGSNILRVAGYRVSFEIDCPVIRDGG